MKRKIESRNKSFRRPEVDQEIELKDKVLKKLYIPEGKLFCVDLDQTWRQRDNIIWFY